MKTKLYFLLAAICCSMTTFANSESAKLNDDFDDEGDERIIHKNGIWYYCDINSDDPTASVIGPESWIWDVLEISSDSYGIYYEGDIVIPSSINVNGIEVPVTSISDGAFDYMPDDNPIPEFAKAKSPRRMKPYGTGFPITSVTLPNTVIYIDDCAFYYCDKLKSITFGNSLESIGQLAFQGCSSLTSIVIPKTVTYIQHAAFSYCSSLTSISVEEGNTKFESPNNCNAIIEKSSKKLFLGCKNTIIPEDIKIIGQCAFFGCEDLTSITIPDNVQKIEDSAFRCCI